MGNPRNPVFYENKVKVMHSEMSFENGHIQPNLETCPVCGKNIARPDRKSIIKDGQHWHIHKTCAKRQNQIVKEIEN